VPGDSEICWNGWLISSFGIPSDQNYWEEVGGSKRQSSLDTVECPLSAMAPKELIS